MFDEVLNAWRLQIFNYEQIGKSVTYSGFFLCSSLKEYLLCEHEISEIKWDNEVVKKEFINLNHSLKVNIDSSDSYILSVFIKSFDFLDNHVVPAGGILLLLK